MVTEKKVLLIGATGGIGHAILQHLILDDSIGQILATYHRRMPSQLSDSEANSKISNSKVSNTKANDSMHTKADSKAHSKVHSKTHSKIIWLQMDVSDEHSIAQTVQEIAHHTVSLNWVINAVGLLHNESHQPEKTIGQMQPNFFVDNMTINALASLLIAKHIKPLLKASERSEPHPAIFATISARVGSITDNRVGGWYSYRMSKAALNMGMKTLSIEWQRSLKNVCVTVMQPGTVDTPLSKPYQKNVPKDGLFAPEETAQNLLTVLNGMRASDTGSFVDWAGKPIPW